MSSLPRCSRLTLYEGELTIGKLRQNLVNGHPRYLRLRFRINLLNKKKSDIIQIILPHHDYEELFHVEERVENVMGNKGYKNSVFNTFLTAFDKSITGTKMRDQHHSK